MIFEIVSLTLLLRIAHAAPTTAELAEVANKILQQDQPVQVCDERDTSSAGIYCYGDILQAVNIHGLFNDSKTFVDMPLKADSKATNDEFHKRFNGTQLKDINVDELRKFVNEYFSEPGTELEECQLTDWTEEPVKIMRIKDKNLRAWALQLNQIWKKLCRKMKAETEADRHSLIYVPNEFVAPGGRFREFYYWDAYWIVKGLLASGMTNTTKAMLDNFAHVVSKYNFIPNGGRVYYLRRSQPPFLAPMVYEYYEETHDQNFLINILPILETELNFWWQRRSINITGQDMQNYTVFQYRTESTVPRPESFRADLMEAMKLNETQQPQFYQNAASAAESGWDFSTRWFADKMSLHTIETTNVVPIDLNAILCWNMNILNYLYRTVGDTGKALKYRDMRDRQQSAMSSIFYNDSQGAWFDYNIRLRAHNTDFYPSVTVPLFADCYQPLNLERSQRVVEYMNKSGAFNFVGGVPQSLIKNSNQQWDFPNGWSPSNHMIIEGLRKSLNPITQEQGIVLAQKWVEGNYRVFKQTGAMWEKYDVIGDVPQPGAGGEYNVQDGFGWTNGAILDLLTSYFNRLSLPSDPTTDPTAEPLQKTTTTASSMRTTLVSLSLLIISFSLSIAFI